MAATKRLGKEYKDILDDANLSSNFKVEHVGDNILHWSCVINPTEHPFNKGAFKFDIVFPAEYPFKPPKLVFKTKIYHPNIDEKGQVCLGIISPESWKPATKTKAVLDSLMDLVNIPQPDHPLRADLAEEFLKDKKKFNKNVEEHIKKHAEKRSSS